MSDPTEESAHVAHIEDVVLGMKYACLSITDDEDGTLKNIGKSNPWHTEALKMITGSEDEAYKPLSTILSNHLGLTCDKIIDISGVTPGGQPLDTQGYIAHNDETIVLSYRCSTTIRDWLTNLDTTSSEWELEEDLAQGFAGYCSGLEGLCCGDQKPRVHTGFYNNFLSSVPLIREYIEPLLGPDQPPRKLFVVGHSLGAGIATLASCYFLLRNDWNSLPQTFVGVTAGSPRACQGAMREVVEEQLERFRPSKTAVMFRIVLNKDVVATVPPNWFGFKHLGKLVYINNEGKILVDALIDEDTDSDHLMAILTKEPWDESERELGTESTYERLVKKIPRAFRDHMPDFYLKSVIQIFEKKESIDKVVMKISQPEMRIDSPVQAPEEKKNISEDTDLLQGF